MPDQPQFTIPPVEGGGGTCFLSGTRIAAPEGSVCVEDLSVGALVLTATGESRPIRWLGHRGIDCTRYRDPSEVWPYRIRAGAFADGTPQRDVWLSRGHSIFIDGSLIQVERLVNGATIAQVPREHVEYWHVELDSHDVLLAEGLPAESYLSVGNRPLFSNSGTLVEAFPNFEAKYDADETCVPLAKEGPVLEGAKAALLERAKALGYRLTDDADLHIRADGVRIEPMRVSPTRWEFSIPLLADAIELRSHSFVPAHIDPASDDVRTLGVGVANLELDGVSASLEEAPELVGWHPLEKDATGRQWRWTVGCGSLPARTRSVVLELCHLGPHYWTQLAQAVAPSLDATG
jgi:hypothetical protein